MEYALDIYVNFAVIIWFIFDSRGVFIHIFHGWFTGKTNVNRAHI